jgi:flavodoxin
MLKNKKLVVYFSKVGEQYNVGIITEGNTAIVAKFIASAIGADIFEVKVKNDTYSASYKTLADETLREKKISARPNIVGDVTNFDEYDTVFIGSPNWWADMPMALYTFIEAHDWSGKTIAPFVTHEGSGLSSIPDKIKTATNADVLKGLAVYGHVAQNERDKAEQDVQNWLKKLGF